MGKHVIRFQPRARSGRAIGAAGAVAVSVLSAIGVACVASSAREFPGDDGGGFGDGGRSGDALYDTGLNACATDTQRAKQLPLDIYIMQDTTGSMNELVSPTRSKFVELKDALISFVNDPASAGIGVGLQYFPLHKPGVPDVCTTTAECGTGAICLLKICTTTTTAGLTICNTDPDCPTGETCVPTGQCANQKSIYCNPAGSACGTDDNGFSLGNCSSSLTSSICVGADSCVASQYATPSVPIAAVPGAAAAIAASLNAKTVGGKTPTSAALQGAEDQASAYAVTHPGHTLVTVLATNGVPNECDVNTDNIANIARVALAATPSVRTFVIGVFASAAEQTAAQPYIDKIAAAGGTTKAFIVTAGSTTSTAFVAALNSIRVSSLPCEYILPVPEAGTPDFGKFNVQYTPGSGMASVVGYAMNAAGCDAVKGGWYYDIDPIAGGRPTKVVMCPSTCAILKSDLRGKVDLVQGCQTQNIIK